MIQLRDYQIPGVLEVQRLIKSGRLRPLIVDPTGAGKGTKAAYMLAGIEKAKRTAIFLVNRIELVKDMSKRLRNLGIRHGIIQGSRRGDSDALVHVASIDTIRRRATVPHADVLFVDEAHFSVTEGWKSVLDRYPNVPVIGMTATPVRADGRGLGEVFTDIVLGPSVRDLTEMGYLVPTKVLAPHFPKLRKKTTEWTEKELSQAMDKPKVVGDAVEHWLKYADGVPTVAFPVNCDHSRNVVENFRAAGVPAEHVQAETPSERRDEIWAALIKGEIKVVSSVGVISYGWDCPPVACAILLRPTQSVGLFLQQCGRILRPFPGKEFSLILDHAGNHHRHGCIDDERIWTLDGLQVKEKDPKDPDPYPVRMCDKCMFIYPKRLDACPTCGAPYKAKSHIRHVEGELKEIKQARYYRCDCGHRGRLPDGADPASFPCHKCQCGPVQIIGERDRNIDYRLPPNAKQMYAEWIATGIERNYRPKWAIMTFHREFHRWPPKSWTKEIQERHSTQEVFQ